MRRWDSSLHRYSSSFRSYPSRVPAPEYEVGVTVRQVRSNGEIRWKGDTIYVSESLKGEPNRTDATGRPVLVHPIWSAVYWTAR